MAYVVRRNKIWYIRYKDAHNRWQYKSCGKSATRAEADFLSNQYSAQELNRHHNAPVRIIKTDLNSAFITFRDQVLLRSDLGIDKQDSSVRREKASVNNVIEYLQEHGINQFKQFDNEIILKYLEFRHFLETSAKTRKEELRLIRKFIKWAMKQHFLTNDPTDGIIAPKVPKGKPRFFTEKELQKIFTRAKEPYLSIYKFLYLTGLRSGELTNLEWRDYDEKNRILTIRIVSQDKKNRTPGNKTKREETIPINDFAHQILMERKAVMGENQKFIFLNHAGNRLDNDNIYRNLMLILSKENIDNAKVHTFRHTFASHLVIAGVSIYKVKELLRHASIRETEIYSHLSKESTRNAVDILDMKIRTDIDGAQQQSQKEG